MRLKYFVLFWALCTQAFCSEHKDQGSLAQFIQTCNEQSARQAQIKERFRELYPKLFPYEIRTECLAEHTVKLRTKAKNLGLKQDETPQFSEEQE